MKTNGYRILISAAILVGMSCSGALADLWFSEDFESDLSAWTGKSGAAHNGVIVADPLNSDNRVLTFTAVNSHGDIFTLDSFSLIPGQKYTVSFDFLGLVTQASGGSGGFAGLSEGLPGSHMWYYGTNTTSGAAPVLVDDRQWHHYEYEFTSPVKDFDAFHLMFEDFWSGSSGGIAGDAYFDNITLRVVPLPGAALLGALGLGLAGWRLRRRPV
jgi:hypothetical protein